MRNKSLIVLQEFALTSGSEVLDDIQRITDGAKEKTGEVISRNKTVIHALVDRLVTDVLMNEDSINRFFREHPIT
jgi:hypothetical protein